MPSIVDICHLDKYFGRLHVLKNISFSVDATEVVCIIGRSGSGKSTLLRCINFLETPDHGSISVDGIVINASESGRSYHRRLHKIRLKTGMVFQSFNLFPHMTVLQNVIEGPITVKRTDPKEAIEIGKYNLEKVGLTDKRDEYPSRLSGGQQQRVAIARALAMQPKIMLFDEPTSSLDPELIAEVLNVMQQLVEDGMTMLIVTHEMGFARNFADRVIFINEGHFVEVGSPDQIFSEPRDQRTQIFLDALKRFNQAENK